MPRVPSQLVRSPDGNVWHYVSVSFECTETLALECFPLRRLPPTLVEHHRIRIRDASSC
jgi:hypothetical protein